MRRTVDAATERPLVHHRFWLGSKKSYSVDPALYAPLREFIQEGDVVFAPAPLDAHLLGAGFRNLPDDSLDKVITYAERTGVRWLVVARKWHNRPADQAIRPSMVCRSDVVFTPIATPDS